MHCLECLFRTSYFNCPCYLCVESSNVSHPSDDNDEMELSPEDNLIDTQPLDLKPSGQGATVQQDDYQTPIFQPIDGNLLGC